MRNPTRKGSDGLHFLRLGKLPLQLFALGDFHFKRLIGFE